MGEGEKERIFFLRNDSEPQTGISNSHGIISKTCPLKIPPREPRLKNIRPEELQKFVNISHDQALVPWGRRPRIRYQRPESEAIGAVVL
jgi:hypothetical protein